MIPKEWFGHKVSIVMITDDNWAESGTLIEAARHGVLIESNGVQSLIPWSAIAKMTHGGKVDTTTPKRDTANDP